MSKTRTPHPLRGRLVVLAVLGMAAVALMILGSTPQEKPAVAKQAAAHDRRPVTANSLEEEVLAVCAEFGIPEKAIRKRTVKDRAGHVLRPELRLAVPPDFSTYEFNYVLSSRVGPFGANVVGAERTRDRTVTLSIVRDETILESVILETRKP
ncbi:MAG: hypothetical protein IT282_05850 [Bacteroidetes bacterium]|nr:hypothetical protein [Bacteroidota bacterium]